jgi:hypothetical protein
MIKKRKQPLKHETWQQAGRHLLAVLQGTTSPPDKDWLGRTQNRTRDWLGRKEKPGRDWLGRK